MFAPILKKRLTQRYPIPFAIYLDVTQFMVVALLLSLMLEWLLGYRILSPSRFATIGAILGTMKSVARLFNREWTTQLPIWKRVTDEHFVSLCFVLALPLAGAVTPKTKHIGTFNVKPKSEVVEPPQLTWQEKVNHFNFETMGAISYSIREANGWILLFCSLSIESLVIGGKQFIASRWRRRNY